MKFRFKGVQEYINKLEKLSDMPTEFKAIEEAVKAGAAVVADESRKGLESVDEDDRRYVKPGEKRTGLRRVQKVGLLNSWGISDPDIQRNYINVKTGVSREKNKLGEPNVVVARRLERGTSWMNANPVISKANRRSRQRCVDAMMEVVDKYIDNCMK